MVSFTGVTLSQLKRARPAADFTVRTTPDSTEIPRAPLTIKATVLLLSIFSEVWIWTRLTTFAFHKNTAVRDLITSIRKS